MSQNGSFQEKKGKKRTMPFQVKSTMQHKSGIAALTKQTLQMDVCKIWRVEQTAEISLWFLVHVN